MCESCRIIKKRVAQLEEGDQVVVSRRDVKYVKPFMGMSVEDDFADIMLGENTSAYQSLDSAIEVFIECFSCQCERQSLKTAQQTLGKTVDDVVKELTQKAKNDDTDDAFVYALNQAKMLSR
jgi:cytolysin (calcineurin-like family phosphatase)